MEESPFPCSLQPLLHRAKLLFLKRSTYSEEEDSVVAVLVVADFACLQFSRHSVSSLLQAPVQDLQPGFVEALRHLYCVPGQVVVAAY